MVNIKLEFAHQLHLVNTDTGDTWAGFRILFSISGSHQAIIEVPARWATEDCNHRSDNFREDCPICSYLNVWHPEEIIDWRPEHTYGLLGWPEPAVGVGPMAVGDTFGLHGVSPEVREMGRDGEGAIIAVCDTGVDVRHQAFSGIDVTGDVSDGHGHGTHVASTAASHWGIARKARILSYAVLSSNGNGSEASVANGIRAATDAGAHVINLSLGGAGSQIIDAACEYAKAAGAVVVAAAGNSGMGAPIGSPARAASICVGACDRSRNRAGFSSGPWGYPNYAYGQGVNVEAAATGTTDGVNNWSGTSMATPHIVGLCALLAAAGKSYEQIVSYVLAHLKDPPAPGFCVMAADFVDAPAPPEPPPAPEEWVPAIDVSYEEVSFEEAQALYAQGYRLAVQCILAAPPGTYEQPAHRVTNLRNFKAAGFHIAGYIALRPEYGGSYIVDRAKDGFPQDLWEQLYFVAPDIEIEGISLSQVLSALARLHTLGQPTEVVYTNYSSWHDEMGNPPFPLYAKLWNASWDGNPDVDYERLPFGGVTLDRVCGEQYQGDTVVSGVHVDLNVFRKSFLPPIVEPVPVPPPEPEPPVPPEPPPAPPADDVVALILKYASGRIREVTL